MTDAVDVVRTRFDLDNPKDVALLIHMDRMATRAAEFEKALRALVRTINGSSGALAALVRVAREVEAPIRTWENEGGAL